MVLNRDDHENDNDNNNDNNDDNNHSEHKLIQWLRRCIRGYWKKGIILDEKAVQGFLASFAVSIFLLLGQGTAKRLRRRRLMLDNKSSYHSATEAPLSLLYKSASQGQISSALLGGSSSFSSGGSGGGGQLVYYLLQATGDWKKSFLPASLSSKDLVETLSKTCDHVAALPESFASRLVTPILAALPFVYLFFLSRILKDTLGGSSTSSGLIGGSEDLKVLDRNSTSNNTITFADVAGMPHVVTEIAEVVRYLSHPDSYMAVGARPPRAILLHGPPGSGKTLLAQAVAGQAGVPFFACSASEFVEVYVGRGAARVRTLFQQARQAALRHHQQQWQKQQHREQQQQRSSNDSSPFGYLLSSLLPWSYSSSTGTPNTSASSSASSSPSSSSTAAIPPHPPIRRATPVAAAILFIDELDALAKTRVSGLMVSSNDEREQTLNQLLTELDGFGSHDQQQGGEGEEQVTVTIIVIAASNRMDVLDPAIMRRFDRQIYVGYPVTSRDRKDILQVHARRVVCGPVIDWDRIASEARTGGCSGADLSHLVNEAALLAVREGSATIEQEHFDHAARRIQQMKWKQEHPGETFLGKVNAGIR